MGEDALGSARAVPAAQASQKEAFDVFLSYSRVDAAAVENVAKRLSERGFRPWFDHWCLTPGGNWQTEIAEGLAASAACAVFVGPEDLGAWERLEVGLALDHVAKRRNFRVFPALLPGFDPLDP